MKRRMKDGKFVYYYWTYDENGIRKYRSTGERTKAKALEYVMKRRDEGLLGERDARTMTLNEFCAGPFAERLRRRADRRGLPRAERRGGRGGLLLAGGTAGKAR